MNIVKMNKIEKDNSLMNFVWHPAREAVWDSAWNPVITSAGDSIGDSIWGSATNLIRFPVRSFVWIVGEYIEGAARDHFDK